MYYVRFGMMDYLFAQKVKETKNYSTSTQKTYRSNLNAKNSVFWDYLSIHYSADSN